LEALNRLEEQIESGTKRTREGLKSIGKALYAIRDKQLYAEHGFVHFDAYVETRLGMERHIARRIMECAVVVLTLESSDGVLRIPSVEAQLLLLGRVRQEDLVDVWRAGLDKFEKSGQPVTTKGVKLLVNDYLHHTPPKPKGVHVELKGDDEGKVFSEQAEQALERIGRLCGNDVKQSILDATLEISERDLIRWAQESDQMVKNFAYYIVDLGWSLRKAIEHEETVITTLSTVQNLVDLASARGGSYAGECYANNSSWELSIKKRNKPRA
jgi:hypothetical protein